MSVSVMQLSYNSLFLYFFELNLPPSYVTRKPALYRDFLQFGRVALELLPQDLITVDLLAAYPPLVPPARDDLDAAGDPMYQLIDRDPSKSFTNASELEWFENNKVFKKTKAELFRAQGIVITYLDSRLSAAAQEALHAKTDFGLLRSANNLVKIFELIDTMLMFGPKKSSIGAARNFLLGLRLGLSLHLLTVLMPMLLCSCTRLALLVNLSLRITPIASTMISLRRRFCS